jgi:hypothetical protein
MLVDVCMELKIRLTVDALSLLDVRPQPLIRLGRRLNVRGEEDVITELQCQLMFVVEADPSLLTP